jgi:hypothetical protein
VVVETTIGDDETEPRPTTAPAPLRLMQRFPVLQAIPGYLVGIGLLPEHAPDFATHARQPESQSARSG